MLSSSCNFAAQHIYTEPLRKPGEVKYLQLRLNPANICQRRQISADFFRSAQSVHFLAPESTSIIAPPSPPKRPIFYTYMSLCCTCIFARVLFSIDVCCPVVELTATPTPASLPLSAPVDRCPAQSRKSPSTPSPLAQTRDHPHIAQLTFLTLRETTQEETLTILGFTSPTTKLQGCSQTPCPTPPRLGTGQRVQRGRCLCK